MNKLIIEPRLFDVCESYAQKKSRLSSEHSSFNKKLAARSKNTIKIVPFESCMSRDTINSGPCSPPLPPPPHRTGTPPPTPSTLLSPSVYPEANGAYKLYTVYNLGRSCSLLYYMYCIHFPDKGIFSETYTCMGFYSTPKQHQGFVQNEPQPQERLNRST